MNIIDKFIDSKKHLGTSTIGGYQSTLTDYFITFLKVKPNEDYLKKDIELIEEDIKKYFSYLKTEKWNFQKKAKGLEPISVQRAMTKLKKFFESYRIMFYPILWDELKSENKGYSKTSSIKKILAQDDLALILNYCKPMYKSLFLMSATTGARISEVLNLEEDDIDFTTNPIEITIYAKGVKTGQVRIVYMTPECKKYYDIWMSPRKVKVTNDKGKEIEVMMSLRDEYLQDGRRLNAE